MNYKLVELNNKTRKGLYIYLKQPGQPGKYYKTQPGTSIKTIIQYHQTRQAQKKGQKTTTLPLPKKRKTRRRTLESTLAKGIKTVKLTTLNTQQLKNAKKRLFKNIVKDKDILNIIITNHNLNKIKHRFDYTLTAKDKNNKTLFTAEKLNITPDQALNESQTIKKGTNIKEYTTLKQLQKKGWTINHQNNGTINTITMQITFRKN